MNHMLTLLKREYQESRGVMVYLPILEVLFLTLILVAGLVMVKTGTGSVQVEIIDNRDQRGDNVETVDFGSWFESRLRALEAMSAPERKATVGNVANGIAAVILIVLWFVVFFYLLASLYDERRDRSILFWKSMPVSDTMTVLSKLGTALVVMPLIYILAVVVAHLVLAIAASIGAASVVVSVGDTIWGPANLLSRWATTFASVFLNIIWCLPLFTWVLFVSSWARSVPLIWVIAVPIGVTVIDWLLLPGDYIRGWMTRHSTFMGGDEALTVNEMVMRLLSVEMLITTLISLGFIYGAIWMRGRSGEI